ncbi:MAG: hypothetical protein U0572_00605 [Phycisphaerales bacterium]
MAGSSSAGSLVAKIVAIIVLAGLVVLGGYLASKGSLSTSATTTVAAAGVPVKVSLNPTELGAGASTTVTVELPEGGTGNVTLTWAPTAPIQQTSPVTVSIASAGTAATTVLAVRSDFTAHATVVVTATWVDPSGASKTATATLQVNP